MDDAHVVAALLDWRSQYERLREFAGTVGRLQLELLKAVAAEHARRDEDLADWALTMYDHIHEAVVLHIAALQKVAPLDDDDAPTGRSSTSWIEDSAVELGRLIDAFAAPDAIVFPEHELSRLLELQAA